MRSRGGGCEEDPPFCTGVKNKLSVGNIRVRKGARTM